MATGPNQAMRRHRGRRITYFWMLANVLPTIPAHTFLDTSVVNFILDYGPQIHDGLSTPENATRRVARDIDALQGIWLTGQRASWHVTISAGTIAEIEATGQPGRLHDLLNWASELWGYSDECEALAPSDGCRAQHFDVAALSVLPDAADRHLIQEAVEAGCDAFCTRDWKTILRHRSSLHDVPLSIISPHEWWDAILPYAPLFA